MTSKRRPFDGSRHGFFITRSVGGFSPRSLQSINAVNIIQSTAMPDIYQSSLDQRFELIMRTIVEELGIGGNLNGLTADRRADAEKLAEQAIINWAVASKMASSTLRPLTNLQHLLSEYCALADHL